MIARPFVQVNIVVPVFFHEPYSCSGPLDVGGSVAKSF